MKNIKSTIFVVFLSASCAISTSAQQTQPLPSSEELQKRITQMEEEIKEMREELAKIRQSFPVNQAAPQMAAVQTKVKLTRKMQKPPQSSRTGLDGFCARQPDFARGGDSQIPAGNPWARIPQIKVERKLNKNFTWAGAILAPQTGDFSTGAVFFLQPTSGASSSVPFLQTRIALADANFLNTKKAGSVGLSAHYGRSRVFTGATNTENDIDSLGVALDWNFPLAERLNLSGEAFFGRNLGGFQAGVFQSDFAR